MPKKPIKRPKDTKTTRWIRCVGGPLHWVRIELRWAPTPTVTLEEHGGHYELNPEGDAYVWLQAVSA